MPDGEEITTPTQPGPQPQSVPGSIVAARPAIPRDIDRTEGPRILVADDDNDSSYATSMPSDTTSLKSSIFNYVYENGRRYHRGDESALLPNDETEQDRLDLQHHMFLLHFGGKTHMAPIENPHRALDIGTGTGVWALDFAEQFPEAEVIGVDITPIQPSWVLPNCRFEISNVEESWTFRHNYFDFIHTRNMAQGIHDWSKYLARIYKALAPGGYVELTEISTWLYCDDGTFPGDCYHAKLARIFLECTRKIGLHSYDGAKYVELLQETGFERIEYRFFKQPNNPWPKDKNLKHIGHVNLLNLETGVEAYSLALLTRLAGKTPQDAKELCRLATEDMRNRKFHGYMGIFNIIARKPGKRKYEHSV